ncbi:uncharacterized protein LOC130644387 [Hydractinia symbiolongicarpus]|uniref:uncharacterized protein LOC130644387 n=1 Tax=Hydractinia symbiolongicarpus TaxID=13093 RepID=UPI0025516B9C|nr:uncharacterized protein LOC130644387 [Hydractinia symbiolongicarpus]
MLATKLLLFILFVHTCHCLDKMSCNSSTRVIIVTSKAGAVQCEQDKGHMICPNLTSALSEKNLNGTCIKLLESQTLYQTIPLLNVHNFILIGNNFNCCCNHENASVGLSFENSSSISITNIIFTGCGGKFPSTSAPPDGTNHIPYISTALHFKQSNNILFSETHIIGSMGYAVTMYDCGGPIRFQKSHFESNTPVPFVTSDGKVYDGYTSGGGVYLEYTSSSHAEASNNMIDFHECYYVRNVGESYSADTENYTPFGRGAGMSIFFMGSANNNSVTIRTGTFEVNRASWGAGLYVSFGKYSNNNVINVTEGTLFAKNNASLSGGGMRIVDDNDNKLFSNNVVKLTETDFQANYARVGGGFSQYRGRVLSSDGFFKQSVDLTFTECIFSVNQARLGAAMYLEQSAASFINLKFKENNYPTREAVVNETAVGVLYSYRSKIAVGGNNEALRNYKTVLVLDYSTLTVDGKFTFVSNNGDTGGAIALYEHSKIYLTDLTELLFQGNTANKGGAIYMKQSGPKIKFKYQQNLHLYNCFLLFKNTSADTFNGNVTFIDNVASKEDGNAIHATTLQDCLRNNEKNASAVFTAWRHFNFTSHQSIATDPLDIILYDQYWENIWPGKLFKPKMKVIDETLKSVLATVDIRLSPSGMSLRNDFTRFVVTNEEIKLTVLSNSRRQIFNVTIHSSSGKAQARTIKNIQLLSCPFGYSFSKRECVCSQNLERGISQCIGENVYLFDNMWAKPHQEAQQHDAEKILYCPQGYCNDDCKPPNNSINKVECLYQKYNQCKNGRDQNSTLCGKCRINYSVTFGSERCADCRAKWWFIIWLVPSLVIFFGIIIVFVLLANFDIYDNYISVIFFFYQVAHLTRTPTQKYDPVMRFFSGIINLDGLHVSEDSSICVWDGFNDMQKMAFNYIIPFIMIVWLGVITLIGTCKRDFYFNKTKCLRAFVFVMTWAYSDITRITFSLLHKGVVDTSENSTRLYIYGDVRFFKDEHLYIGSIAIVFLVVVVIGFPLLLMFANLILSCKFVHFKPIFDLFNYCFKDTFISQLFPSYYFVCRCILLAVSILSPKDQAQLTRLAVICIFVLAIFSVLKPYKKNRINNFDMFVLVNLSAIALLSNGKRSLYTFDPMDEILHDVMQVLMWPPLVLFFIFLAWKLIRRRVPKDRRPALLEACVCTDDETE